MLLFAALAVFFCCSLNVSAATATISVDKATLGQGFLLEPTTVEFSGSQTVADVTILALGKENLAYTAGNSYLRAIRDDGAETAVFPQYILDEVARDSNYHENADTMNAEGRINPGWLGEFDYYNMSGWMLTVNNFFIDESTANWPVRDGDVIRWQFTVSGYGRDIGEDKVAPPYIDIPDKDDLCKRIAEINDDKDGYINGDSVKQRYYDNAVIMLTTLTATAEQVDMALANLNGTSAVEPALPDPNFVASDGPAVAAVEAKISAIGNNVTLASRNAIADARTAYDGLLRRLRPNVTNYHLLTAAEERYDELVRQAADDELAAENVMNKIAAIGTVTLDRKEAVTAARSAYDGLTAAQKKLVTNYDVLTKAETRLAKLEAEAAANQAAADSVTAQIAAIGTVTANSGAAIKKARNDYDALTSEQRALVTNVPLLTAAEEAYAVFEARIHKAEALIEAIGEVSLNSKNAIEKARSAYDELSDDEQKQVKNEDLLTAAEAKFAELVRAEESDAAAADQVKEMIAAIGTVTADSGSAITAARTSYDALTAAQKKRVTNIETLRKAEARYAELTGGSEELIAAAETLIDAIGTVTEESGDRIAAARENYDVLTSRQKNQIRNYAKLLAAEAKYASLIEKAKKDQEAADSVAARITAIGEVTLDSENAVSGARKAYDALTAAQKKRVENSALLTAAEAELARLKAEAKKSEENRAAAADVSARIAAIGEVTEDSKDAIAAARAAFDALTEDQKSLVNNVETLLAAEDAYAALSAEIPFADIEKHWARDAIISIYRLGLVNGVSENRFAPDMEITRGMVVTILYRLEGEPAVSESCAFNDVAAGRYYRDAVIWAND
ncbi:MAG: S-layer homology domain-containing protein, partial [Bacillota bacterium]